MTRHGDGGEPLAPALAAPRRLEPVREFEFTAADFERVRQLIHRHAGIALTAHKQDMVYSRLVRRLRACGEKSFASYLARLESGDPGEWEAFVNALTTNLTSFFREAHHFEALSAQMRAIGQQRPIRIWSCAASSGEEAYSIAIAAVETFATWTPPVSVLASDLDTNVLRQAQAGVYAPERLAGLSAARVDRFFQHSGAGLRVRAELQRLVRFQRINLLEPLWPVMGELDAIFCRNVMIYFDRPTQYRILDRFRPLLRREGRLYAGHSENFMHAGALFRPLGRTVYELADAPAR